MIRALFISTETDRGPAHISTAGVRAWREKLYVDKAAFFHYSACVRWFAILIFAALLHDIFVPPPALLSALSDGQPAIVTLDVCHASSSQLTDDDDMPGVAERPGSVAPSPFFEYRKEGPTAIYRFLLSSRNDDPPEPSLVLYSL